MGVKQIKRTPRTSIGHAHFYDIRRRRRGAEEL